MIDVVGQIMAYESGDLDLDEEVKLFEYLVSTGMVWGLQGSYGRRAQALIDMGLIGPNDYDYDEQTDD